MKYPPNVLSHLVTAAIVEKTVLPPDPDSHKGQNGKILIIGGSPLFHGAGRLSATAATETAIAIAFASRTNDMVYFCSTQKNLDYMRERHDAFIGITRAQLSEYLALCDVVLSGPGLMREPEAHWEETEIEPDITRSITEEVLSSNKKIVLDAGSLQVLERERLRGHSKVIITPHGREMSSLFGIRVDQLFLAHDAPFEKIEEVATLVQSYAKEYNITILLKGPINIIASEKSWFFSPGGNAGMTKGGTGDTLAGVVAALYARCDDPVLAAACGSYVVKRTSEELWDDKLWFYNATDLSHKVQESLTTMLVKIIRSKKHDL